MTAAVQHRGPDGGGLVTFGGEQLQPHSIHLSPTGNYPEPPYSAAPNAHALLGHRRLSIVERTELGHQPMSVENDRYWITYNGEIYNHVELRQELEAAGVRFRSHSDTEVLLWAYVHWGVKCLSRLNGMFAFVIFDRTHRKIFVGRDRFGVKPLYLWRGPGGVLAIASEIKQFTVLPGWQAKANHRRTYDFLAWSIFDHTDDTLFESVSQLRGGEYLHLDMSDASAGTYATQRWYRVTPSIPPRTLRDATKQFQELFEDSVRLRLRADVPVGSCLSGGLDSSSIVCVASRLLRSLGQIDTQNTFSARAETSELDEYPHMRSVIEHTGVHGHYTVPTMAALLDDLPALAWHQDEPFGSTGIFAQWCVFRLAQRTGVKVMLDGQGADEAIGGYSSFWWVRLDELAKSFRVCEWLREARAVYASTGNSHVPLLRDAIRRIFVLHVAKPLYKLIAPPTYPSHPWLNAQAIGVQPRNPFDEMGVPSDDFNRFSEHLVTAANLPMLLHWEDRNSMAHGIEARVPFLDYRMVEFVLGLPSKFKLYRGETKTILRNAMDGVIPDSIKSRRDKLGFTTPEQRWICGPGRAQFGNLARQGIEAGGRIFSEGTVRFVEEILDGKRPFDASVWRIISLGQWMKHFNVSFG